MFFHTISSALIFLLSYLNIKQLAYLARVGMFITVLVIAYVLIHCSAILLFDTSDLKQSTIEQDWQLDKDLIPNFLLATSVFGGVYEGIPMAPSLFCNAREKN